MCPFGSVWLCGFGIWGPIALAGASLCIYFTHTPNVRAHIPLVVYTSCHSTPIPTSLPCLVWKMSPSELSLLELHRYWDVPSCSYLTPPSVCILRVPMWSYITWIFLMALGFNWEAQYLFSCCHIHSDTTSHRSISWILQPLASHGALMLPWIQFT